LPFWMIFVTVASAALGTRLWQPLNWQFAVNSAFGSIATVVVVGAAVVVVGAAVVVVGAAVVVVGAAVVVVGAAVVGGAALVEVVVVVDPHDATTSTSTTSNAAETTEIQKFLLRIRYLLQMSLRAALRVSSSVSGPGRSGPEGAAFGAV